MLSALLAFMFVLAIVAPNALGMRKAGVNTVRPKAGDYSALVATFSKDADLRRDLLTKRASLDLSQAGTGAHEPKPSPALAEAQLDSNYTVERLDYAKVSQQDLVEMTDLYNEVFATIEGTADGQPWKPYSPERFRDGLRWGLAPQTFVARYEGRIVALLSSKCSFYRNFGNERYIASLATAPDHRRKGVGTELLRLLLAHGAGKPVRLDTNINYEGKPHLLYERLGFEVVHRNADGAIHMRFAGDGMANRELQTAETQGDHYDFFNGFCDLPKDNFPKQVGVYPGGRFEQLFPELFKLMQEGQRRSDSDL
jgi:GNAT superfamily N-acetyltransferase